MVVAGGPPTVGASGAWSAAASCSRAGSADPAFPAGGRYFFKSRFLDELSDQAIEVLLS